MFPYCVVGNGLIGAALTLEVARHGAAVIGLGAHFGDEGVYFSSHEDDARIYRTADSDPYWQNLARRNRTHLLRVASESGLAVFAKTPVLYSAPPSNSGIDDQYRPRHASGSLPEFIYEDNFGGIINPKLYIQGMNMLARELGATLTSCIVRSIDERPGYFQVFTSAGEFQAERLIEARGAWTGETIEDMPPVAGKIALYVESPAKANGECFCIIDAKTGEDAFVNAYACCHYRATERGVISRLGFTERQPILLTSVATVANWFVDGYKSYPFRNETNRWLKRMFHPASTVVNVKPCVFSTTSDGRPLIRSSPNRVVVAGCNGLAAKACQALAEDILGQWI